MAEKLTWDDAENIGVLLTAKYPGRYPLSVELDELRGLVTGLAEFNDEPSAGDEDKLEAIRGAWNDEFLDRTQ